jgi:peroxiredoxin
VKIAGKTFFTAAFVLMMSVSLLSCHSGTAAVTSSEHAAGFTLQTLDGDNYDFADRTKGKVVILNFWAKRCPPCKAEIPDLIAVYGRYRDKGLEVIGVDVDAVSPAQMRSFVAENRINYPVLTGAPSNISKVAASYGGFRYIPTTFIIDREGRIAEKISGPRDEAYFEAAVKKLL